MVVGFDAWATSPGWLVQWRKAFVMPALTLYIGLAGTEEVYASVSEFDACGGIEVTSHNPIEYNGMKIVGYASKPLSDQQFSSIRGLAEGGNFVHLKNWFSHR